MIRNVLFLEDNDAKFKEVSEFAYEILGLGCKIHRARTMVEAQKALFAHVWNLYLLDISMDVVGGSRATGAISQATLGGMSFARMISIEGLEAPTILVTAFDSFSDKAPGKTASKINDLNYVTQGVLDTLGRHYRGAVRFGAPSWRESLRDLLQELV